MMKRIISIALILIILVSILPVTAFAASGTSRSDAIPVNLDEAYTHTWTADNDDKNHYISFTVPSRGLIAIACTYPVDDGGDYGDMAFAIYNQSGTCVWKTVTDYETPVEGMAVLYTGLNAGKYYMNITPRFTVVSGEFPIVYALTHAAADDTHGTEAEPNNDKAMADTLTVGKEFVGSSGEGGVMETAIDYWKYNNTTNAVGYRVYLPELEEFRKQGQIFHEDSTGNITDIDLIKDVGQTEDGTYFFDVRASKGTNYIKLVNYGGVLVPYSIRIEPFKNEPLAITRQPVSVATENNTRVNISLEVTGELLSFTWYEKLRGEDTFLAASNYRTHSVVVNDRTNCMQIYCVITDAYGNTVQSDTIMLSMLTITQQPADVFAAAGEKAMVRVEALGDGVTYQWYVKSEGETEFSPAPAFTGNTYSATLVAGQSDQQVFCIVTDRFGNTKQTNTVTIALAGKVVDSGSCGTNAKWEYTNDGTLIISGTGSMFNYTETDPCPWRGYRGNIKTIVVKEGIAEIGNNAFTNCKNATKVEIAESVKKLGSTAFGYCYSLSTIDLPDNLESIANGAFYQCSGLTTVYIPESVKELGTTVFSGCAALEDVAFPEGLTTIPQGTFHGCESLKIVVIPETVTTIERNAFYFSGIECIYIPARVTSIGTSAFNYCQSLKHVYYGGTDKANITMDKQNDYLLDATWHYNMDPDRLYTPGDLNDDGSVDNKDVEYLLWHTLFAESYPLNQEADFDGNGRVDNKDVEYLLWHTLFAESYPLH